MLVKVEDVGCWWLVVGVLKAGDGGREEERGAGVRKTNMPDLYSPTSTNISIGAVDSQSTALCAAREHCRPIARHAAGFMGF